MPVPVLPTLLHHGHLAGPRVTITGGGDVGLVLPTATCGLLSAFAIFKPRRQSCASWNEWKLPSIGREIWIGVELRE